MLVLLSWKRFNTSHVTLYQAKMEALFTNVTRFNTSHVTLYLQNVDYGKMAKGFQYISCYSLSQTQFPRQAERNVSIHLMLLFIRVRKMLLATAYVVSIHLMLLFIQRDFSRSAFLISFNTSHVTLYLACSMSSYHCSSLFQYISCYSLSITAEKALELGFMFQYISCYSLSAAGVTTGGRKWCFNTSHVTLYPNRR